MCIRVGNYGSYYWVECKQGFKWKKLPSISHWKQYKNIRFNEEYIVYYKTYEEARTVAEEYIAMLNPKAAVYVEIK